MSKSKNSIIVDGKKWIPSIQDWSFIITIVWMTIANIWKPFGLFGFVCMFTPIIIAITGRGKMHCARVCPRGSLIATVCKHINIGLKRPNLFDKKGFKFSVWCIMMGSFIVMLILTIPKGIYVLGNAVLIFMETATAIALIIGILFKPRTWCTICPMGFSTANIRKLTRKKHNEKKYEND